MALRPLQGFVVGVTADRRWQEQAELLERRGATVLHGPTISTLYLADDEDVHRATLAVVADPPDYLVATTGIGVRAWLETAAAWGLGDRLVDALATTKIVARGPKAAAALQAGGLEVWERSPTEQMEAILDLLLAEPLEGQRVVVQEYGMESPPFVQALTAAGADVLGVTVYRWRRPDDPAPALRLVEAACERRVDAVTFTSAPAVHNLFEIASEAGASRADDLRAAFNGRVVAACVGPVCAEGARQEGVTDPLVPGVGRLGLLVRSLSEHFEGQRQTLRLSGAEVVVQGSAVEVDGQVVELTAKERGVFEMLAVAPGAVVARAALLEQVWGSAETDPHVLEVTVGRLRKKLGPHGNAVQASPGRGYQLDPDPQA